MKDLVVADGLGAGGSDAMIGGRVGLRLAKFRWGPGALVSSA